ncbi:Protein N-acetyltransferase, RimJ/RimL family [Rhodococcus rhodochrous J3]|uniref:GNAT family N-acetyltransferase n=3 Tax=Rhodococcus rhodochrous TaxID=1829 RepID=A0AA46WVD9_RHORH|nr:MULTISPECIES: GNAT family protein [Rhodococcus]MBF4480433.1 GNAT family N-acetyltransferase [Rhodococcus rhodochrous]MCB8911565.1 GNAT family N-acetyltransferase [Rhodococcus rhodochrous]MCD2099709.1 GNAT family N-acetyltransferase [Rhodococcus rhodochrous]MCD2124159.1 GNAT family N-acetyltransferase [Rhodococcus rhodochrous]MCQ4136949.1 GNAT family N-acetyltransferase [Rhodococcus rhodochrous]
MNDDWTDHPVLEGPRIRLEPLADAHAEGLLKAADDPGAIFAWSHLVIRDLDDARTFVREAVADPSRLPYAIVDRATGEVLGSTSYYLIEPAYRTLVIGYTWLSTRVQRTHVNSESKLLLLQRAFDDLGAVRVTWHADERNTRSRDALRRLGATEEGLLRKHRRRRDGSWRTTALFSLTDDEWPGVRARLEERRVR